MTETTTKEITLGEDFDAVAITVNGMRIKVSVDDGIEIKPVNGNTMTAIDTAQKAFEIGECLKDGTIVFGFDDDKNPLRVPEGVLCGETDYYSQNRIVERANADALHGHKTWTRLSDKECAQLAKVWDKVAPVAQRGSAAPWFWGASSSHRHSFGNVYRGGGKSSTTDLNASRFVPVVLRGAVLG
ncbi:MAG: hypothetical protein OXT65_04930 [Alphaproteobacteria bacterium]|nr:hypothetical protein [Alphaproteobacteria bacterium]